MFAPLAGSLGTFPILSRPRLSATPIRFGDTEECPPRPSALCHPGSRGSHLRERQPVSFLDLVPPLIGQSGRGHVTLGQCR